MTCRAHYGIDQGTWCEPCQKVEICGKTKKNIMSREEQETKVIGNHNKKHPASPNTAISTLDTWNGCRSLPLRQNSQKLPTFPTPLGQNQPYNLPQGPLSESEARTAAPESDKTSKPADPTDTHNGKANQHPTSAPTPT